MCYLAHAHDSVFTFFPLDIGNPHPRGCGNTRLRHTPVSTSTRPAASRHMSFIAGCHAGVSNESIPLTFEWPPAN